MMLHLMFAQDQLKVLHVMEVLVEGTKLSQISQGARQFPMKTLNPKNTFNSKKP